ncbi:MAG: B12-binding domain-containing radical SAM protein [Fibrobacterota bacterium]|nr:radical SAM protein [Chitinispirillaceae bacterium]
MRIVTLNPPFFPKYSRESRSPAVAKSGTLYYPMWLAYATGYLEKAGHDVTLIDAPGANLDTAAVVDKIKKINPQLVILDTSTPSIYSDVEIGAMLKKEIPSLFVMLVGVHVSALPKETLELSDQIDAVAFGEYDATVVEVAEKLSAQKRNDESMKSILGLAFRSHDNSIIKNETRPYIQNLDDIPMVSSVYKKHLDISPYFYGHSKFPIIVIVTGRGCPFKCTYCVLPQTMQGHQYRKRSVQSIVDEFRYIHDNFSDVKEIMIEDDTLTADKTRCREFSQALIDAKLTKTPWSANSRADVDYETMRLMNKAGCRLFCVGFESGDQQILDNIQKGTNIDRIRSFVKDAKKAGILIHGCFMVGNRGETHETLEKTLRFAKELSPDTAQFFPIMAYPGTSDFKFFKEKGWIVSNDFRKWLTDDGLHSSVVSNPDLKYEELVSYCDRARKEFYMNPKYLFAKILQALTHPSEAKRLLKGGKTLMKYIFSPSLKNGSGNDCNCKNS